MLLPRQLECFVAVADEGHFARAAERLSISQSTLSSSISKLESAVGIKLVNRGRVYEGLSREGEALLPWARRLLADQDAFLGEAASMREGVAGVIRLGLSPTTSTFAALPVSTFCATHPLVRVQLSENLSAPELRRKLLQFELDAAIAFFPTDDISGLTVEHIYTEQYVLAFNAELAMPGEASPSEASPGDQALNGASPTGQPLSWEEIAKLPLALFKPDTRLRQFIDRVFTERGLSVTPRIDVDSTESLRSLLMTGQWASIVPNTMLRYLTTDARVRTLPLENPVVAAEVLLATASSDVVPATVRAFADSTLHLRLSELAAVGVRG